MAGEDDVTELELVGYTADMQYLVLSDPSRRGSRWYVPIDEDFLNTVEELVQDEPRPGVREDEAEWSNGQGREPGIGPLAAVAAAASERGLASSRDGERPSQSAQQSKLSPRQIQALLRAGKSPKTVAKQADADEAWVRRWLAPIESERSQVLQAVWANSVTKSRLGRSHDLVGEAVRKNLSAKGVDPDSDAVTWSATRKEGATAWTVTLRYRNRGSAQRAVWRFDPERHLLEPRNQLAVDIAWTRPRQAEQALGTGQTTTAKKTAGDRSASKKQAAKKGAAKKGAAKKGAAKKGAAKKHAGKKHAGKKHAGKKAAAKKSQGTKSAAKKATAKKSGGPTTPVKKTAAKKPEAAKSAAKKSTAAKSAAKKSTATKSAAKKTAKKSPTERTTKKASGNGEQEGTSSARGGPSPASGSAESSERQRRG